MTFKQSSEDFSSESAEERSWPLGGQPGQSLAAARHCCRTSLSRCDCKDWPLNIDQEAYFFVFNVDNRESGEAIFEGLDLHGGLSSEVSRRVVAARFVVGAGGSQVLSEQLSAIHRSGRGHALVLKGSYLGELPVLLTTDETMKWAFSSKVRISTNDPEFDFEEFPAKGIPLCGRNWVGVLQAGDEGFHLCACARDAVTFAGEELAFCPDWSEGFDDPDPLIFHVERWCDQSSP